MFRGAAYWSGARSSLRADSVEEEPPLPARSIELILKTIEYIRLGVLSSETEVMMPWYEVQITYTSGMNLIKEEISGWDFCSPYDTFSGVRVGVSASSPAIRLQLAWEWIHIQDIFSDILLLFCLSVIGKRTTPVRYLLIKKWCSFKVKWRKPILNLVARVSLSKVNGFWFMQMSEIFKIHVFFVLTTWKECVFPARWMCILKRENGKWYSHCTTNSYFFYFSFWNRGGQWHQCCFGETPNQKWMNLHYVLLLMRTQIDIYFYFKLVYMIVRYCYKKKNDDVSE